MDTISQSILYKHTGFFSNIVLDYIDAEKSLQAFYSFTTNVDGIKKSINERKNHSTNQKVLIDVLKKQYANVLLTAKQQFNIEQLNTENCFTITTAHQPNIFTGHLYFIYKILHAVKIAEKCKKHFPKNNFVPIFYMGSEDADLDELNHIFISGQKYTWQTNQTGAVGRMKVDKPLLQLIDAIAGQTLIQPFGKTIIDTIKDCYKEGTTIEQATFNFVNFLFKDYGVLVLLPDNRELKKLFIPIIEKELSEAFSEQEVIKTVATFPKKYKAQASGRALNLFYLKDDIRERIVLENTKFIIHNSTIKFSKEEIINELHKHPERFSPNVILRPVFQEMLLPNIVFVGGGGEIAYWLQLKNVFKKVNIPYPVLVLRNSLLFVQKNQSKKITDLGFTIVDLFNSEQNLINQLVKNKTTLQLSLTEQKKQLHKIYEEIKILSVKIDATLNKHTDALQTKALQKIEGVEKKMLKAEKKKFEAQQRQLHKIKTALFPNNNLQERVENIIPFYAKFGADFINVIYKNLLAMEQQFVVLTET